MKPSRMLLLLVASLALPACAVNGTYVLDPALTVPVYIGPAPVPAKSGESFTGTAGWKQEQTGFTETAYTYTTETTTTEHNNLAAAVARAVKDTNSPTAFASGCTFTMEGDFGDELVTLRCTTADLTGGAR